MTDKTDIEAVDMTSIMENLGIKKVERTCGRFAVLLDDGRIGVAGTAGKAYSAAMANDAFNVKVAS